jgi:SAM-dependent methyltransferase
MNPGEYEALSANEERLWWFRGMRRIADVLLDRYCAAGRGARILEAGCGTGYDASRFARERGWEVTVVDLSPVAAGLARRRGLEPALADIRKLPFRNGSFEGLISLDVLVHLEPEGQSAAIGEFARVVSPGGWMLLRVAALKALRSRHSEWVGERHRVRLGEVRAKVEAAGLRVLRATYANSLLLPVALMKFRVWEPLTGAAAASGVELPAGWLNGLLELPLRVEAEWLRAGGRLPIGQSVWVVASKAG